MMELVTEYLVIVEKKASEAVYHLCDDIGEFNKLLKSDPDIEIEDGLIYYKQLLKSKYEVKAGEVEAKDQRFFHVRLTFNDKEEHIEDYTRLLRSIKGTVHKAGGQPETLWDDVSFYYSRKAYPLIHKIENLMRKLITYFMLTNVGKEWVTEASPSDVREAIDKSKRKQYLDVLHQTDFKHLGDLLFKPYQTRDISELYVILDGVHKSEELDLDELRSFASKSNWERYFSAIVGSVLGQLR
jgi:Txe/YoeB family toxin of Txe-Axe toxin-antitoxin module